MQIGDEYGESRVGIAVSDPSLTLALARPTATVSSVDEAVQAVVEAVEDTGAAEVVVGLPLNMDGSAGPMVERVRTFVAQLEARLGAGVRVSTWDERLSSAMAERAMLDADLSRQKRRRLRDRMAAQAILQSALDARAG